MSTISEVSSFRVGSTTATAVYAGASRVWPPNLFLNSGFDDASAWSLQNGATISGGYGVFHGGDKERFAQIVLTSGRYYRASLDIVTLSAGVILFGAGLNTATFTTAVGRQSLVILADGTNAFFRGNLAVGQIDNVDIYEVPAP